MEKPASFDLNLAIQHWRESLAQSPAFRRENLNELESHLRDSIAALQTHGLSAEEAFMVAAKRVGKGGLLETEFGKVNGKVVWLDRTLWMLIGFQIWMMISQACLIAESATGHGIGKLATQRMKYDELHRTFFNTHGPGLREYALNVMLLFITPLALALVTVIAWKCLLKSDGRIRTALTGWLAKPARLALSLFILGLSFHVFTSCFQVFEVSPKLDGQNLGWWSRYVAGTCLRFLPAYGISATLIAIFARKRLRACQAS